MIEIIDEQDLLYIAGLYRIAYETLDSNDKFELVINIDEALTFNQIYQELKKLESLRLFKIWNISNLKSYIVKKAGDVNTSPRSF